MRADLLKNSNNHKKRINLKSTINTHKIHLFRRLYLYVFPTYRLPNFCCFSFILFFIVITLVTRIQQNPFILKLYQIPCLGFWHGFDFAKFFKIRFSSTFNLCKTCRIDFSSQNLSTFPSFLLFTKHFFPSLVISI